MPDPRVVRCVKRAALCGLALVLAWPALRGSNPWIGWWPLWLVGMPLAAWWALCRFALPAFARAHRRSRPKARRWHRA